MQDVLRHKVYEQQHKLPAHIPQVSNESWTVSTIYSWLMYEGVSKSFKTSSIHSQPMAVCECVRCAWEKGTSSHSMSGVAVWTLGVAQPSVSQSSEDQEETQVSSFQNS